MLQFQIIHGSFNMYLFTLATQEKNTFLFPSFSCMQRMTFTDISNLNVFTTGVHSFSVYTFLFSLHRDQSNISFGVAVWSLLPEICSLRLTFEEVLFNPRNFYRSTCIFTTLTLLQTSLVQIGCMTCSIGLHESKHVNNTQLRQWH